MVNNKGKLSKFTQTAQRSNHADLLLQILQIFDFHVTGKMTKHSRENQIQIFFAVLGELIFHRLIRLASFVCFFEKQLDFCHENTKYELKRKAIC